MGIREETFRYLGYGKRQPDGRTAALTDEVIRELEAKNSPKSIYREFPCEVRGDHVRIGGLEVESRSLSEHLLGCGRAVLLAATIGRGADMMIQKYSVSDMAKAAIAQAAGAAFIERYVDELEEGVREGAKKRGLSLRPRFSPGYGDFPLECQKDIFAILECGKRIGMTLTEGNLMMPSKSVTAVIGLSKPGREDGRGGKCEGCGLEGCEYRAGA